MAQCKSCGYECKWLKTQAGKWILVELDSVEDDRAEIFDPLSGMIAHYATCPEADNWRKGKRAKR